MLRFRSDLQSSEETIEKKQREIDRLKRELSRFSRSNSPAATEMSEHIFQDSASNYARDGSGSNIGSGSNNDHLTRTASMTRSQKRLSYASNNSYSQEEKENGFAARDSRLSPTFGLMSNSRDRSGAMSPALSSEVGSRGGDGVEPIESWKRAAQVTSQLKMRIEQMKARQNLRGPA